MRSCIKALTAALALIVPALSGTAMANPEVERRLKQLFDNTPEITLDFTAPDLARPDYARCRFVQELQRRGGVLRFTITGPPGARRVAHERRLPDAGQLLIAGDQVTFSAGWGTWGGMACTYRLRHASGGLVGTMSCSGHGSSGCPAPALGMRIDVRMSY